MITRRNFMLSSLALAACGGRAYTKPESYQAIIPFGRNGATGTAYKAVKSQMESSLGVRVAMTEMAGEGGLVGSRYAWENRRKGNVLLFHALKSIETYNLVGAKGWNASIDRFRLYSIWKNSEPIVAVSHRSEIDNPDELIERMQQSVQSVSTAGIYSSGDMGARTLAKLVGVQYRAVRKKGGASAISSTIVGESAICIALHSEMQGEIEKGTLRPILSVSDIPAIYKDYVIPPLGEFIEKPVPSLGSTFGFAIYKNTHPETLAALDRAWQTLTVAEEAGRRSVLPRVIYGELARSEIQKEIDADRWALSG